MCILKKILPLILCLSLMTPACSSKDAFLDKNSGDVDSDWANLAGGDASAGDFCSDYKPSENTTFADECQSFAVVLLNLSETDIAGISATTFTGYSDEDFIQDFSTRFGANGQNCLSHCSLNDGESCDVLFDDYISCLYGFLEEADAGEGEGESEGEVTGEGEGEVCLSGTYGSCTTPDVCESDYCYDLVKFTQDHYSEMQDAFVTASGQVETDLSTRMNSAGLDIITVAYTDCITPICGCSVSGACQCAGTVEAVQFLLCAYECPIGQSCADASAAPISISSIDCKNGVSGADYEGSGVENCSCNGGSSPEMGVGAFIDGDETTDCHIDGPTYNIGLVVNLAVATTVHSVQIVHDTTGACSSSNVMKNGSVLYWTGSAWSSIQTVSDNGDGTITVTLSSPYVTTNKILVVDTENILNGAGWCLAEIIVH